MKRLALTVCVSILTALSVGATCSAQSDTDRVWTINEILDERQAPADVKKPSYCMGDRYKPCVCAPDVSKLVQYRPSIAQCGRNAGVIFSGRYLHIYSVVVRDKLNRDRFPERPGFNGCSASQYLAGLSKCSAFKVQKIIRVKNDKGDAEVHCLGANGYSRLFRGVSRITVKLRDVPGSHTDPLERLCLMGPRKPLN